MGSGQSKNMIKHITQRSGSSNQPVGDKKHVGKPIELLPYPKLLPFKSTKELKDLLCYVMPHYGTTGIVVLIERRPAGNDFDIRIQIGDWNAKILDLQSKTPQAKFGIQFMTEHAQKFIDIMRTINLPVAQFYFATESGNLILTDIRQQLIKFTGPGMVRDIFSKIAKVPEVIKIDGMTDDLRDNIDKGFGIYSGDLIIKPSRFRTIERTKELACPLFVEVRR